MYYERYKGRVTLTKGELQTEAGQAMIALIEKIGADKAISLEEISDLLSAVNAGGPLCELAGANYLREVILQVIDDGKIDVTEAERLRQAMARVLPKAIREKFEMVFPADIEALRNRKPAWHSDPITDPQMELMIKLGLMFNGGMTKGEACELISAELEKRNGQPSERQLMVLRFWNRMDLATLSKRQICDWMDSFYAAEPLRIEAWELWKAETNELSEVPIGGGEIWLQKVKNPVPLPAPPSDPDLGSRMNRSSNYRAQLEPVKAPPLFPLMGYLRWRFGRA